MLQNLMNLQAQLLQLGGDEGTAQDAAKLADDVALLKSMSFNDLISRLADSAVSFVINLAIALVVFYAGRFVIRKIHGLVASIFIRRGIDRSLSVFVLSLINMTLYFILIVTVIGIIGIETTSFLALFASAGVAIGMALSGTLQNFAGGVLILLLKPYRIGDYIEAQGYAGTVKEIQIFFTVITTPDNKSISIPNGGLSTGSVNNWTRENYRRVSWTVSISYGDEVDKARAAILDMFAHDPRVMKPGDAEQVDATPESNQQERNDHKPDDATDDAPAQVKRTLMDRLLFRHRKTREAMAMRQEKYEAQLALLTPSIDFTPKVFVGELGASSVDLTVRAWTRTADYWAVFYHYNEAFYNELPKFDVHFPFPQLDVHMTSSN